MKKQILNRISEIRALLTVARKSKKASITKIKNSEKECYVLGNGPSLKDDLHIVKSTDTVVVVNKFAVSPKFEELKPEYYVLADPLFFESGVFRPITVTLREEVFKNIKEKTKWNLKILVPTQADKSKLIYQEFTDYDNIEVYTFNNIPIQGSDEFRFRFYEKAKAMPAAQNVLVAALYCCIFLNFKQIYVLGADHSWHEDIFINEKNQVCLVDKHFYDDGTQAKTGKPWKRRDHSIYKMSEILAVLSKMFRGYDQLKIYSEKKNIKITNKSSKTYIDAFERDPA